MEGELNWMDKKTCTSIFLIPYLVQDRARALELGYINGYIRDTGRDVDYKNPVFALFKPERLSYFQDFLNKEKARSRYLVDDYDYEGYTVIVYEFPIPEDYKLFLEGRYSEMSTKYKEGVSSLIKIGNSEEPRLCWRICNKTPDVKEYWETKLGIELDKDMEYYSKPILEKETLQYDKF